MWGSQEARDEVSILPEILNLHPCLTQVLPVFFIRHLRSKFLKRRYAGVFLV